MSKISTPQAKPQHDKVSFFGNKISLSDLTPEVLQRYLDHKEAQRIASEQRRVAPKE